MKWHYWGLSDSYFCNSSSPWEEEQYNELVITNVHLRMTFFWAVRGFQLKAFFFILLNFAGEWNILTWLQWWREENSIKTYLVLPSRVESLALSMILNRFIFYIEVKKILKVMPMKINLFVLLCIDGRSFMIIRMIEVWILFNEYYIAIH